MSIGSENLAAYLELIDRILDEKGLLSIPLSSRVLAGYGVRDFVAGRAIQICFSDGVIRDLNLLFEETAAVRAPRIALADKSKYLVWPHVEEDGVLCLGSVDSDLVAVDDPAGVLLSVINDACGLIEDCLSGIAMRDFLSEANSYWAHDKSDNAKVSWSLIDPKGPSRPISMWAGTQHDLFGDDPDSIKSWIANSRVGDAKKVTTDSACFLWLPKPLEPSQFPRSAADVSGLAELASAKELLSELIGDGSRKVRLLIGAQTESGPFLGAITIPVPHTAKGPSTTRLLSHRNGFRPGHQPPETLQLRFLGAQNVLRGSVERVDPRWVHGRTFDERVAQLLKVKIAVVGCGSVGSSVARLLAQAGVGHFIFVDPQVLASANTARHALGSAYLRRNKAEAMAEDIAKQFPHIGSVSAFNKSWERLTTAQRESVCAADLIICAIGISGTEFSLNAYHRNHGHSSTILFGWLEAHAMAAHAVVLPPQGSCFRCGFDADGRTRLFATEWLGVTTRKTEPACSTAFQPYGAIDMQSGISMIAEAALDAVLAPPAQATHTIHVSPKEKLTTLGGQWSKQWVETTSREDGDFTFKTEWPHTQECPERHD